MKQFLLIAGFFAINGWVKAQDFIYSPSQHMSDTIEAGEFRAFHMDIAPADSSDITLKWQRVSNTLDDNYWSFSLCDYPSCYPGVPASGQMGTVTAAQMQNGVVPFFQLAIATHDSAGDGMVSIYVYDASDFNKGDTISFHLVTIEQPEDTSGTTGMAGVKPVAARIFPNPANDLLTVESEGMETIRIYDITGHLVYYRQAGLAKKEILDLNKLAPGTYTIAVKNSEGLHIERLMKL